MSEDERTYACRQHCGPCKRSTDHFHFYGSRPICGDCWERFYAGWLTIPEAQREALKGLRDRFKRGALTEYPVTGVDARWEPC